MPTLVPAYANSGTCLCQAVGYSPAQRSSPPTPKRCTRNKHCARPISCPSSFILSHQGGKKLCL
eukprot:207981-Rhodomonas_salina.3